MSHSQAKTFQSQCCCSRLNTDNSRYVTNWLSVYFQLEMLINCTSRWRRLGTEILRKRTEGISRRKQNGSRCRSTITKLWKHIWTKNSPFFSFFLIINRRAAALILFVGMWPVIGVHRFHDCRPLLSDIPDGCRDGQSIFFRYLRYPWLAVWKTSNKAQKMENMKKKITPT